VDRRSAPHPSAAIIPDIRPAAVSRRTPDFIPLTPRTTCRPNNSHPPMGNIVDLRRLAARFEQPTGTTPQF
jgi:hypothetical protein